MERLRTEEYDEEPSPKKRLCNKRIKRHLLLTAFTLLLLALTVSILLHEFHPRKERRSSKWSEVEASSSKLGKYAKVAVVGGGAECSGVGTSVLKEGGHAVDAAIAVTLCLGVVIPYSLGIGGGHFSVIYQRKKGKTFVLNARETAPLAASADMYSNKIENFKYGGMSSGVPGEIKGHWEAHKKFGRLPWKRLFKEAIQKARDGIKVHEHYEYALHSKMKYINGEGSIKHLVKSEKTGDWLKMGDLVKQPKLAETLEAIAENGYKEFYSGVTGENFIKDVQTLGGILTMDDLKEYKVKWLEPVMASFSNRLKMYSVPPPGSGALVAFMLHIMDGYNVTAEDRKTLRKYADTEHRMVEAEKFAFAHRAKLGDADFVDVSQLTKNLLSKEYAESIRNKISDDRTHDTPYYNLQFENKEDFGTGHVSVVDEDGNAVALTSTINFFFGSKNLSTSTGIIIGNIMEDFSLPNNSQDIYPPSPLNFITPGKRPQSSMCPSIFLDEQGNATFVVGAAGGTKITTAVALVSLRHLWLKRGLKESVDERRLHHQLIPKWISYEEGYPEDILEILEDKGHSIKLLAKRGPVIQRTSVVQAISRDSNGQLLANADFRKRGFSNGY